MAGAVPMAEGGAMTTTEQPALPLGSPDDRVVGGTPLADAPDADWLAQVRRDAGRWWSTGDGGEGCPLTVNGARIPVWQVWHAGAHRIGGVWLREADARLWLWVALGLVNWSTLASPARLSAEQLAELAAAEARLRAALGIGGGR